METGLTQSAFYEELHKRYPHQAEAFSLKFEHYLKRLIEVNSVMNLTAIEEPNEIREKHFLDCLLIESEFEPNSKIADIGSGAGFPGLVLAIVREDCHLDLIEPTTKRCTFLQTMVNELKLKNVKIINRRAEECMDLEESYDGVTARAVAKLSILLELCVPLLKVKGKMVAMKGSLALEELKESSHALKALYLEEPKIQTHHLPSAGQRINLVFTKQIANPTLYPRAYRLIKKNPL